MTEPVTSSRSPPASMPTFRQHRTLLTSALTVLENQLQQAQIDLVRLKQAKDDALQDPASFVSKLKKKQLTGLPQAQRVIQVPTIDWVSHLQQHPHNLPQPTSPPKLLYRASRQSIGVYRSIVFNGERSASPDISTASHSVPVTRSATPTPADDRLAEVRAELAAARSLTGTPQLCTSPPPADSGSRNVGPTPVAVTPAVSRTTSQSKARWTASRSNVPIKPTRSSRKRVLGSDDDSFPCNQVTCEEDSFDDDFAPGPSYATPTASRVKRRRSRPPAARTASGARVFTSRTSGSLYDRPLAVTDTMNMSDDESTVGPSATVGPTCSQCRTALAANDPCYMCLDCPAGDRIQLCVVCRTASVFSCGSHRASHRLKVTTTQNTAGQPYYHDKDYAVADQGEFGYLG